MNRSIIIKIAVGVSAAASLFSLVTLIRAIIIGSNPVFPIIQVVGSAAIFLICFMMFRALSSVDGDEEKDPAEDGEDAADGETEKEQPEAKEPDDEEKTDELSDELYEKYHMADFEEAGQEQE